MTYLYPPVRAGACAWRILSSPSFSLTCTCAGGARKIVSTKGFTPTGCKRFCRPVFLSSFSPQSFRRFSSLKVTCCFRRGISVGFRLSFVRITGYTSKCRTSESLYRNIPLIGVIPWKSASPLGELSGHYPDRSARMCLSNRTDLKPVVTDLKPQRSASGKLSPGCQGLDRSSVNCRSKP